MRASRAGDLVVTPKGAAGENPFHALRPIAASRGRHVYMSSYLFFINRRWNCVPGKAAEGRTAAGR
jgi:hypothetical protein